LKRIKGELCRSALWKVPELAHRKILNPHLAEYRVLRFSGMPQIDVVVLDRKDIPPVGAGETPIMALAGDQQRYLRRHRDPCTLTADGAKGVCLRKQLLNR